jgi:hypothetical protein
MKEIKICPMKFSNKEEIAEDGSSYLCEKKECAWWDENGQQCSIVALSDIANVMWND